MFDSTTMLRSAIKAKSTKQRWKSSAGNRQSKHNCMRSTCSASPAERTCNNKGSLFISSYSVPKILRLANALSCHGLCEAACCEPSLQEEHTWLNQKISQVFRATLGAPGSMKCTSPLFKLPAVLEGTPPGSLLSATLYRIQRSAADPDHLTCICDCQLVCCAFSGAQLRPLECIWCYRPFFNALSELWLTPLK